MDKVETYCETKIIAADIELQASQTSIVQKFIEGVIEQTNKHGQGHIVGWSRGNHGTVTLNLVKIAKTFNKHQHLLGEFDAKEHFGLQIDFIVQMPNLQVVAQLDKLGNLVVAIIRKQLKVRWNKFIRLREFQVFIRPGVLQLLNQRLRHWFDHIVGAIIFLLLVRLAFETLADQGDKTLFNFEEFLTFAYQLRLEFVQQLTNAEDVIKGINLRR